MSMSLFTVPSTFGPLYGPGIKHSNEKILDAKCSTINTTKWYQKNSVQSSTRNDVIV